MSVKSMKIVRILEQHFPVLKTLEMKICDITYHEYLIKDIKILKHFSTLSHNSTTFRLMKILHICIIHFLRKAFFIFLFVFISIFHYEFKNKKKMRRKIRVLTI